MSEVLPTEDGSPYRQLTTQELASLRDGVLSIDGERPRYPWQGSREPYRVFVAEILLRKTRVADIASIYEQIVAVYPTVQALASADSVKVKELVQPLGLAGRGDNLVSGAEIVLSRYQGSFPTKFEQLEELPGVGRYIANAIRCIGFGESAPMVDEGVGRLLRRYLGVVSAKTASTDSALWGWSDQFLSGCSEPESLNLGLIYLSETRCRPKNPLCFRCPLRRTCDFATKETV